MTPAEYQSTNNLLMLFVKYPEPGKVKTRLGREIGNEKAAKLYEDLVNQQINDLSVPECNTHFPTDNSNKYHLNLYVDDHHDIQAYQEKFGHHLICFHQQGDDLGERMDRAITHGFHRGYDKVILIGSDIPMMDAPAVDSFFCDLEKYDMVIGPTLDGGYYMIGFRNHVDHGPLFYGVSWSSNAVFKETLIKAKEAKINFLVEKLWFDIDTSKDLDLYNCLRLSGELFSKINIRSNIL